MGQKKVHKCQTCHSKRIIIIQAKADDGFTFEIPELNFETEERGYAPDVKNITDTGDYMCPEICLECGQIQGKFPVKIVSSHLSNICNGEY